MKEILTAYDQAKTIKGKPTIIIAHTIKGKGVSFMEGVVDFHGRAPTKEETEKALKELS
jgi:transketolase